MTSQQDTDQNTPTNTLEEILEELLFGGHDDEHKAVLEAKQFTKLGQSIVNKVKLGSALDSLLVLSVFVSVVCIAAYVATRESILLYLGATPVLIFCICFIYFMITDPDKLRSEEHEQI